MALQFDSDTQRVLLLVSLGVILLAGAVFIGLSEWTATYSHSASVDESITESDEPMPGERLGFESLSSAEQEIFLEAVQSDDVVWTRSPVGDQFDYPRGTAGAHRYYIEHEGQTYRLTTKDEDRFTAAIAGGVGSVLAISGLMLLVAGLLPVVDFGRRLGISVETRLKFASETIFPLSAGLLLGLTLFPFVFFGIGSGLSSALSSVGSVPGWLPIGIGYVLTTALVTLSTVGLRRLVPATREVFLGTLAIVSVLWILLFTLGAGDAVASGGSRAVLSFGTFLGVAVVVPGMLLGHRLHQHSDNPPS